MRPKYKEESSRSRQAARSGRAALILVIRGSKSVFTQSMEKPARCADEKFCRESGVF
jgi:hypothetical protein